MNKSHCAKSRVLFILKKGGGYDRCYGRYMTSPGLRNSAQFVFDMLLAVGVTSKIVVVTDNNDIDREVTAFKPTIVFVEALWVEPSKFAVLHRLHPKVQWVIRIHSEFPFLACEGIATKWMFDYLAYPKVRLGFNSERTADEFRGLVPAAQSSKVLFLPNYYPLTAANVKPSRCTRLRVACFGALRPLKNQLIQAVAAITYANDHNYDLEFHINAARQEGGGGSVLKNLRYLFANQNGHRLVEHGWYSHGEFINVVRTMDLGLQVSFTESFNIVTADFVDNGVPVVTSPAITWSSELYQAVPDSVDDIVAKMGEALRAKACFPRARGVNWTLLKKYSAASKRTWLALLKHESMAAAA